MSRICQQRSRSFRAVEIYQNLFGTDSALVPESSVDRDESEVETEVTQ